MVAFSFQKQFAHLVENGKKRQTIRQNPRGASSGKKLQLYYGQRTKQCRKLRDAICKKTQSIILRQNEIYGATMASIWKPKEMDKFARKDGFKDYTEMWKFFEPRADDDGAFVGWLIEW